MTFLQRLSLSAMALAALAVVPAAHAGIVTITVTDGTTTLTSVGGTQTNAMITGAQLVAAFGTELRDTSSIIASSNQGVPAEDFGTLELTSKLIGQPLFVPAGGATFTVTASETDFVFPIGTRRFNTSGSFSFQDAAGRTASAQDFYGPDNTLVTSTVPATAVSGGLIGPFTAPDDDANSFAGNGTRLTFPGTQLYSLTDRLTQTLSSGDTSIASTVNRVTNAGTPPVPEPATVLSLLAGIPVLGLLLAPHRRRTA